jgi:hypothetical protein
MIRFLNITDIALCIKIGELLIEVAAVSVVRLVWSPGKHHADRMEREQTEAFS